MIGLTGFLIVSTLVAFAVYAAFNDSFAIGGGCLVTAFIVFIFWPIDRSQRR